MQNTLGTIEGEWKKVIYEMRKIAQKNNGELIISFFRAESLSSWDVTELYPSVSEMVGEPDLDKTDFKKGIFISKSGYASKWRNKKEIEQIKQFFQPKSVNEIWTDEFCVLHIQY